ncbi:MAG TPA: hypothetical protein VMT15_04765 [Bryobacteraceae bacterium]|nr:hypothetical protein [Bryobacteraceae bacterium]
MTLFVAAVLVVAVTLFLTLTIRTKDLPPPSTASPTQHLEDRRAQIYENLRDLQFEYRVGKLSDEDYQQTKLGLQKELAAVLAEIGKFGTSAAEAPAQTAPATAPAEKAPSNVCPHCNATFPNAMKFCGECGKAMS